MLSRVAQGVARRAGRGSRIARVWYARNYGRLPVVKVYGLLRTGTNYITSLVDRNFRVFCLDALEGGWKHGPCNHAADVQYIFMVKDPYGWLDSFMEWERIHGRFKGESISEFLETPVTHGLLRETWGCNDVVETWNRTIASWASYIDMKNTVYIRYEDILASFDSELDRIGSKLGLTMRESQFCNLEARADDWKTPKPRRKLSKDYYRNEGYLQKFSDSDFSLINERLDHDLIARFGYRLR